MTPKELANELEATGRVVQFVVALLQELEAADAPGLDQIRAWVCTQHQPVTFTRVVKP